MRSSPAVGEGMGVHVGASAGVAVSAGNIATAAGVGNKVMGVGVAVVVHPAKNSRMKMVRVRFILATCYLLLAFNAASIAWETAVFTTSLWGA